MSYSSRSVRQLYDRAPVWLRSLAASAYGLKTHQQRFGGSYQQHLADLGASEHLPTATLLSLSKQRADEYADWARRFVPRYASQLAPLAIMTKQDVRAQPRQFDAAPAGFDDRTIIRHTSGTTGTPLEFPVTVDVFRREYAFSWQHRSWHGCPRGVKTATIAGHPVIPTSQHNPPFWIQNHFENQLLFSSYHMTPHNLPKYARALERFAPQLIHGYPSSVALVAAAVIDAGCVVRPRAVITASETLLPHQRSVIRDAFHTEPRVWYGNTELAGNIVECPEGRLHNREEHSYVEFLDAQGQPAQAGSEARLVVSAFGNRAFALIRYDTEDVIVLSAEATCPCGRGGRLVDKIVGRVEDFIVDASGALLGRLDHLFKEATGIKEAQLVQHEPGEVIVRLVPVLPPSAELETPIRQEASLRFSPGTRLRFEYVDSLEKTAAGKTKFVISHIRSQMGDLARLAGETEDVL